MSRNTACAVGTGGQPVASTAATAAAAADAAAAAAAAATPEALPFFCNTPSISSAIVGAPQAPAREFSGPRRNGAEIYFLCLSTWLSNLEDAGKCRSSANSQRACVYLLRPAAGSAVPAALRRPLPGLGDMQRYAACAQPV